MSPENRPAKIVDQILLASMETATYPTGSLKVLSELLAQNGSATSEKRVSQRPLALKIIVVGAGLGGLATAVALRLHGHDVTVFEQASALAEVGAGIQIPPNSSRHLHDWGLGDRFDAISVKPGAMTFRRWQNGKAIAHTDLGPVFRSKFHAPYYVIHRADFHTILHERAVELGVDICLASTVVGYDPEIPSIQLADGQKFQADLVVAADGIKSSARKVVDKTAEENQPTGFAAYRATVPTCSMENDPDMAWLLQKPDLNIWIGPDRHVMTYIVSGGRTLNMVLAHRDSTDPAMWTNCSARRDMEDQFQGWDERLTKIISRVDKLQKWPLLAGGTQKRWISSSKKLLILGDAAHAMLPFMSQGAAMAVEDGAALAAALSHASGHQDLPRVLEVFEKDRKIRTQQMQQASYMNGRLWHFADGPEQKARDASTEAEVLGLSFEQSANQWSDPLTQEWAYGFDATASVRLRL